MNISVCLYVAMSADGFIATPSGDSDWVSDSDYFDEMLEEAGCYILGQTTYEQYAGELFPIEGLTQCLLSEKYDGEELSASSPTAALSTLEQNGFKSTVVVGGAKTWTSFINEQLADELVIEIEPLILGSGMTIGEVAEFKSLELVACESSQTGKIRNTYKF